MSITTKIVAVVQKVSKLTGAPSVNVGGKKLALDVSKFSKMNIADIRDALAHHITTVIEKNDAKSCEWKIFESSNRLLVSVDEKKAKVTPKVTPKVVSPVKKEKVADVQPGEEKKEMEKREEAKLDKLRKETIKIVKKIAKKHEIPFESSLSFRIEDGDITDDFVASLEEEKICCKKTIKDGCAIIQIGRFELLRLCSPKKHVTTKIVKKVVPKKKIIEEVKIVNKKNFVANTTKQLIDTLFPTLEGMLKIELTDEQRSFLEKNINADVKTSLKRFASNKDEELMEDETID